jgi:membrane-bound metal-dependent hydrolase YbcI (DUF457 family)
MANFKTHITVAAALSGCLATGFLEVGIAAPKDVWLYFALGTLGGILPDIDADNSIPGRILFSFFAMVLAFVTLFSRANIYSIVELSILWMVTYVIVRYIIFQMFAMLTIHRGVFHSILAAVFFCFLTTDIAYRLFSFNPLNAWVCGLFVFVGYMIHLILDEMYSVNIVGTKIKKSFGTALKIISMNMKATSLLFLATVLAFYMAPSTERFVKTVLSLDTYKSVKVKLFPKAGWFKL